MKVTIIETTKIYGLLVIAFFQPYLPIAYGCLLHLAMLYARNRLSISKFGIFILAVICIFTGLFFRYIALAYYGIHGVEPVEDVLNLSQFIGSFLGFGGLMWSGSKVEQVWSVLIDLSTYAGRTLIDIKIGKPKDIKPDSVKTNTKEG